MNYLKIVGDMGRVVEGGAVTGRRIDKEEEAPQPYIWPKRAGTSSSSIDLSAIICFERA